MAERVTFTGLGSSMDTRAIIDALLSLERIPINTLKTKLSALQGRTAQVSAYKGYLTALQGKLDALSLSSALGARSVATDTPSGTAAYVAMTTNNNAATGSFKVLVDRLATSTRRTSSVATGSAISATSALATAGFTTAPTNGTFSVNGRTVTIDAATVLSDGADLVGANTILAKIRDATAADVNPVTATLTADGNGTASNALSLSSGAAIQLGSGGDTSNFLTASFLGASPSAGAGPFTRTSTQPLGATLVGTTLDTSRIPGLTTTTAGKLTINGTEITYDTTVDSLTSVMARIGASSAGVTASYDASTDKVTLLSKAGGSTSITVSDTAGNLGAKLQVVSGASEVLGLTAQYQIDNGAGFSTRYASSNTINDALPGVNISLLRTTGATPVAVTIGRDLDKAVNSVRDFVTSFQAAYSKGGGLTGKGGALVGDSGISSLVTRLRSIVISPALGVTGKYLSLADVGVSFGATGSAVGAANTLTLDETKLRAALTDNPDAVTRLFTAKVSAASLQNGGTSSITNASGQAAIGRAGTYRVVDDGAGNISAYWKPDGGSESTIPLQGTIAAFGSSSNIIPGVKLDAGALVAGTSFVRVNMTTEGVTTRLRNYTVDSTGLGGVFDSETTQEAKRATAIQQQIFRLTERVVRKEKELSLKFARMESTLARLRSVQSQLDTTASQATQVREGRAGLPG